MQTKFSNAADVSLSDDSKSCSEGGRYEKGIWKVEMLWIESRNKSNGTSKIQKVETGSRRVEVHWQKNKNLGEI